MEQKTNRLGASFLVEMKKVALVWRPFAIWLILFSIVMACRSEDDSQTLETEQQSGVFRLEDGSLLPESGATLRRTSSSVSMTIDAGDLWPDQTYTIWWIVFNDPLPCQNGLGEIAACGEDDLFGEDIAGTVLFADGRVSDENGKSQFTATLQLEDVSGCQPPFDGFGMCRRGLLNPLSAEIHLVVRSHGPVIAELESQQIQTYAGGCTPETSFDVGEGPNNCIDTQFAVFKP